MDDFKASLTGFIFSLLGSSLLGYANEILLAFILGCIGALGGWVVNRLLNKYFPKDETNE